MSSYCLASIGRVYSFGWNKHGQLGDNSVIDCPCPMPIFFPKNAKIVRISAGFAHVAAMAEDGSIFTWGDNSGALGRGGNQRVPMNVNGLPSVNSCLGMQVICAGSYTNVLLSGNEVYSFGSNLRGRMSFAGDEIKREPVRLEWIDKHSIEKMSLGGFHAICLLETGEVVVYGQNEHSQLFLEDAVDVVEPRILPSTSLPRRPVIDVICGNQYSFLVSEDGSCFCVGAGASFGRDYRDDVRKSWRVLCDVDVGEIQLELDLLSYIQEEQNIEKGDDRTTDMCIWLNYKGEKYQIRMNKVFADVRCDHIIDGVDIHVENCDEEIMDAILKLIYTEKEDNRRICADLKTLLGCRTNSLNISMHRLFSEKAVTGDFSIASSDGTLYKAHKFILIARTSYFKAIFRGEWSEAATSHVDLEMPLGPSFETFLEYIYTGSVGNIDSHKKNRFNEFCDYFGNRIRR